MDRLVALQDAIDHASQTAGRYRLSDPCFIVRADDIVIGDDSKTDWTAGALQRRILDIADRHADECDQHGDCGT